MKLLALLVLVLVVSGIYSFPRLPVKVRSFRASQSSLNVPGLKIHFELFFDSRIHNYFLFTGAKLDAKQWVTSLIGSLKPSAAFLNRDPKYICSPNDVNCLMYDPRTTMANALIGVDLDSIMDKIHSVKQMPIDPRGKPMLVTVRGTGGGKSRLFEEIRRKLLLQKDIFTMAITFNGFTSYDAVEFEPHGLTDTDKANRSAALSILCRMMGVFYGMRLNKAVEVVQDSISSLKDNFDPITFYETAIQLMIMQLRVELQADVDSAVFLLDESMKLLESLQRRFPTCKDPLSPLRKVVLDKTPNSALAMSSLNVKIDGVTDASRALEGLELCEVLNANEIVEKWWIIAGEKDQFRFSLIATMLADLPRALEISKEFLSVQPKGSSVRELLQYVRTNMKIMYPACATPLLSPQLLYATWYKVDCVLNDEAALAIRQSKLTNVLDMAEVRIKSLNQQPTLFTPRGNLVMLSLCRSSSGTFDEKFIKLVNDILKCAINLPDPPEEQKSDVLELFSALVLNGRIGVAMRADINTTPAALLKLDPRAKGTIPALSVVLKLRETMTKGWDPEVAIMKSSSRVKTTNKLPTAEQKAIAKSKFLKELRDMVVNEENPIALRRSATGDCFDLMLKVFDTQTRVAHFIFVDNKAVEEDRNLEAKEPWQYQSKADCPEAGKQASDLDDILKYEKMSYSFVYQMTHNVKQVEFGNLVVAGRQQTKEFMGPAWELYIALRGNFLSEKYSC